MTFFYRILILFFVYLMAYFCYRAWTTSNWGYYIPAGIFAVIGWKFANAKNY